MSSWLCQDTLGTQILRFTLLSGASTGGSSHDAAQAQDGGEDARTPGAFQFDFPMLLFIFLSLFDLQT